MAFSLKFIRRNNLGICDSLMMDYDFPDRPVFIDGDMEKYEEYTSILKENGSKKPLLEKNLVYAQCIVSRFDFLAWLKAFTEYADDGKRYHSMYSDSQWVADAIRLCIVGMDVTKRVPISIDQVKELLDFIEKNHGNISLVIRLSHALKELRETLTNRAEKGVDIKPIDPERPDEDFEEAMDMAEANINFFVPECDKKFFKFGPTPSNPSKKARAKRTYARVKD